MTLTSVCSLVLDALPIPALSYRNLLHKRPNYCCRFTRPLHHKSSSRQKCFFCVWVWGCSDVMYVCSCNVVSVVVVKGVACSIIVIHKQIFLDTLNLSFSFHLCSNHVCVFVLSFALLLKDFLFLIA
jgi:hypothetical protein